MIDVFKNIFWYIILGVCKVVIYNPYMLRDVPDHLTIQEMCAKAGSLYRYQLCLFLITLRPKRCAMRQWAWDHAP